MEIAERFVESGHEKRNLLYNAKCHGICQILDKEIKSKSVHLYKSTIWTNAVMGRGCSKAPNAGVNINII